MWRIRIQHVRCALWFQPLTVHLSSSPKSLVCQRHRKERKREVTVPPTCLPFQLRNQLSKSCQFESKILEFTVNKKLDLNQNRGTSQKSHCLGSYHAAPWLIQSRKMSEGYRWLVIGQVVVWSFGIARLCQAKPNVYIYIYIDIDTSMTLHPAQLPNRKKIWNHMFNRSCDSGNLMFFGLQHVWASWSIIWKHNI